MFCAFIQIVASLCSSRGWNATCVGEYIVFEFRVYDRTSATVSSNDSAPASPHRFEPVEDIIHRCETISREIANRTSPKTKIAA